MLTVACVLRSGGDYTPEYVAKLRDGVAKYLPVKHRFVCFSDVDVPCERIPLTQNWPGWLSKLEIFRLPQALYFDLDTVIMGDLTEIALYRHRFSMLSDFRDADHPASGVMAWEGDYSRIADGFRRGYVHRYRKWSTQHRGDAGWIRAIVGDGQIERLQDVFPGKFGSYKEGTPDGAAVCCFHGKPRPHEVNWDARKTTTA